MRYALVNDKGQIDRFDSRVDPAVKTRSPWRWLPCPEVAKPTPTAAQIIEGPSYAVINGAVVESWKVRSRTIEENGIEKEIALSRVPAIVMHVLLSHENRIRALEQRTEISTEQFRDALKGVL